MEGPLSKWTNIITGWQYRWFVLDKNLGVLSYYTSRDKMVRNDRRAFIKLHNCQLGIDDEDDATFTITVEGKTFHFQARDIDERQQWLEVLEETRSILQSHQKEAALEALSSMMSANFQLNIKDFDRKIIESDAFLQLLIEQEAMLTKRFDEAAFINPSDSAENNMEDVLLRLRNIIELVKHGIVTLQMDMQLTLDRFGDSLNGESRKKLLSSSNVTCVNPVSKSVSLIHDIENREASHGGSPGAPSRSRLEAIWSTSSDSEDEFYECREDSVEAPIERRLSPKHGWDQSSSLDQDSLVRQVIQAENDEFDELYDHVEEDNMDEISAQGSVISHLISQVRIGMDLTKVTLPTFILEKRSILEMYADFLAHPDLWTAISRGADPRARLLACLRWYLSAFHAGRRSSAAKKPYNPILGEVFQCWWDLPTDGKPDQIEDDVSGRPVPWAADQSVGFVAEQVSHHPPISAIYAEQRSSGQFLNGYIWTKSKFLGLSIAVHMVGQGVISLPFLAEEYVVTFPSGYGRSILGSPWVELGGLCRVECPQTGYLASVEFCTKPFYGGKRDCVRAECFAPGEKKSFCVVNGAWNGSMEVTWENGKSEVFVDTKTLPVLKKRVRPRALQASWESRRLWQDVTENLRQKRIDLATTFKAALEQRQRDEAEQRLQGKLAPWNPRYFHEQGEHWVYDKPFANRIVRNTVPAASAADDCDNSNIMSSSDEHEPRR